MGQQRRTLAAAVLIAVGIYQDAIQPGARLCCACKLVCVSRCQRLDAAVVHQVFGVARIVDDAARESVQGRQMRLDLVFELRAPASFGKWQLPAEFVRIGHDQGWITIAAKDSKNKLIPV